MWDAHEYLRFADQRTRPSRDLAERVDVCHSKRIVDLGCGPGNSTAVLAGRWPESEVVGVDNSPQMIAAARKTDPSRQWVVEDIAAWVSAEGNQFDIVFSNAAIQWVDDHATLLPQLLKRVAPGGALAIQMPANPDGPAYRAMRAVACSQAWKSHFPAGCVCEWHVHDLPFYYDVLAPQAAQLDFWETEYVHIMESAEAIAQWYKATGLRPFLEQLPTDAQQQRFLADFTQQIARVYPPRQDGNVLFPFRRLFLIAYRSEEKVAS